MCTKNYDEMVPFPSNFFMTPIFVQILKTRTPPPFSLPPNFKGGGTMNSQEFKSFSNQCNFILKTCSPNYSQSIGLSEMGVKIVKRIFKKYKDPCLGLLEYHNTPITGMSYSPSQLLLLSQT